MSTSISSISDTNSKSETYSPDESETPSGVTTAAERHMMAWRQLVSDSEGTDDLFATIRESYSRGTWQKSGCWTFGAFTRDHLGVSEDEISDILIRRFGMKRYRLLTVSAPRQGLRVDLDETSRIGCGKFGLRMDTMVRTTLAAIEVAPELERLVVQDLLPWALGAKLGNEKVLEAQRERVERLGAMVPEILALARKEAVRRVRDEVEEIVGKPKSAAMRLAERLQGTPKDDLREALARISSDVLREVLPAWAIPVSVDAGKSPSVAEPGAVADSEGRPDDGSAAETADISQGREGDDRQNESVPSGSMRTPNWTLIESAPTVPVDFEFDFGADAPAISRLIVQPDTTQEALLGVDFAVMRFRVIGRPRSRLETAASATHMTSWTGDAPLPAGTAIAIAFANPANTICQVGVGRVEQDGELPNELVFVVKATNATAFIRAPRSASCFGAEVAVLVHKKAEEAVKASDEDLQPPPVCLEGPE